MTDDPRRVNRRDGRAQDADDRARRPVDCRRMDLGSLLNTTLWPDLALLIGRVCIGVCFVVHGLGKLGLVGTGNMQGFIQWLESLNTA